MAQLQQLKKPHSRVTGDYESAVFKIEKNGWNQPLNLNVPKTFEYISLKDLTILETQRNAKSAWAIERLKARGGLDMLALGVFCVARCPDGKMYVWDGAGRWLLADAAGYTGEVPCMVYEITKEQASFYFSYNQEEGRRSMSREATFINRHNSGMDPEATKLGHLLDYLGLYINGDTGICVPHDPKMPNTAEIRYRAIYEGNKFTGGDRQLQRQARDMISAAYINAGRDFKDVTQDFYWAILTLLFEYSELRSGKDNKSFQTYINWLLTGSVEGKITNKWKGDATGISGNSGARFKIAANMLLDYQQSEFANAGSVNLKITRLDKTIKTK